MLNEKILFEGKLLFNRVVFQPMEGCDCKPDGSPSELTRAKYFAFARSGAGIVWGEANAVCPEGRTGYRQMFLTEENLPAFKKFVSEIKHIGLSENGFEPLVFIQLTHSGRQSIIPMISHRHLLYEEIRPMRDENIVTDEYLDRLPELYAKSAALACEAGFDGADVKSCHGYLMQELLSAYSRAGKYGGGFENRTALYLACVRAAKHAVPKSFSIVTRLGVCDMLPKPYGFGTDEENRIDLTEPKRLIGLLKKEGVGMINITLGNPYFNPHVNRPFRKGKYPPPEKPEVGLARFEEVERSLKLAFPDVLFVGTGLSYYREELMEKANGLLENGVCDLVGFGRETLAYPQFYKDYLANRFDAKKCCVTCSRCTELMRHGCPAGCAVYNEYYRTLYKEKVLCKK